MPVRRTLALKREVLQELAPSDLAGVVAGAQDQTNASCLDYISCWWYQCVPSKLICES